MYSKNVSHFALSILISISCVRDVSGFESLSISEPDPYIVLKIDGSSLSVAHVWREIGILTPSMHFSHNTLVHA